MVSHCIIVVNNAINMGNGELTTRSRVILESGGFNKSFWILSSSFQRIRHMFPRFSNMKRDDKDHYKISLELHHCLRLLATKMFVQKHGQADIKEISKVRINGL